MKEEVKNKTHVKITYNTYKKMVKMEQLFCGKELVEVMQKVLFCTLNAK